MQSHIPGLGLHREEGVYVISIIWFKKNYFVAGIKKRKTCAVESSRRTGADDDVGLWIGLYSIKPGQFFSNGFAQLRQPVEASVAVYSIFDSAICLFSDGHRNWRVAYSLCQVD